MSFAFLLNNVFHYNNLGRRYIHRNSFNILKWIDFSRVFKGRCHLSLKKVGLKFLFPFLIVDAGASDLERRNISVLACIDIDRCARDPRLAAQHNVDVRSRRDIVGVADEQHVVGQNEHLDEVDDLLGAGELLVRELWLHAVGLATKVGGVADAV